MGRNVRLWGRKPSSRAVLYRWNRAMPTLAFPFQNVGSVALDALRNGAYSSSSGSGIN